MKKCWMSCGKTMMIWRCRRDVFVSQVRRGSRVRAPFYFRLAEKGARLVASFPDLGESWLTDSPIRHSMSIQSLARSQTKARHSLRGANRQRRSERTGRSTSTAQSVSVGAVVAPCSSGASAASIGWRIGHDPVTEGLALAVLLPLERLGARRDCEVRAMSDGLSEIAFEVNRGGEC